MDIAALAQTVTHWVAPALPYLLNAGEHLKEEAVKTLGENGWGFAKTLWDKLKPKFDEKPAAAEAAQDVAAAPTEEDALAALRLQIKKLLTEDPAFLEEMQKTLETKPTAGAVQVTVSGARAVGIGGSVSGTTIITGDNQPVPKETKTP